MAKEFGEQKEGKMHPEALIPVSTQVILRIQKSDSCKAIEEEYGMPPYEQTLRIEKVARIATREILPIEAENFWKGLELGYTAKERATLKGSTKDIAAEDDRFFVENYYSGSNKIWHLRGYVVGAEMAGVRVTTDILIDKAIRGGMLTSQVAEIVDSGNVLTNIDAIFKSENNDQSMSLFPSRSYITPTVDSGLRGQLALAKLMNTPVMVEENE